MAGVARDPGRMPGKQQRAWAESQTVDARRRSGADVFERWTQGVADGRGPASAAAPVARPAAGTPDIFKTWTQGIADMGDPISAAERDVRHARDVMTKLAAKPPAAEMRALANELRRSLDAAKANAAHAISRPGGSEVAASVIDLIAEADPYVGPNRSLELAATTDDPTAVAAHGVEGAGESLPHYEVVQRAFGEHDLAGVRAHIGGAAAAASRELGAHAYAYGNDIAFAEHPTAELVAHEATHIVQQRAGVALKSLDGGSSDVHEQQANAVERAVATGESAVPLLANLSSAGTSSAASVQRKGIGSPAPSSAAAPKPGGKERYLARNAVPLWKAVEGYLQRVNFPIPDARLQWRNEALFTSAIVAALRNNIDLEDRTQLLGVLYPAEPFGALDGIVPLDKSGAPLDMSWSPAVGHAIAPLFVDAIVASLQRLGPRWVSAAEHSPDAAGKLDERKSLVTFEALIKSAPMDIPVARALTTAAVVELVGNSKTKSEKPRALRRVNSYQWQGPKLWNWIRVTDPTDATPEEVAATLWGKDQAESFGRTSFYAYGITAAPPLFGIPPTWAMHFDDASRFAPKNVYDSSHEQRLLEVASSDAGNELALAQAGHTGSDKKHATVEQLRSTLGDSSAQLNFLISTLARFKLDAPIANALRWVIVRQTELASATPEDAAKWEPVIVQQKAHLRTIVSGVQQVAASGNATAEPIRRVLSAYAYAAGVSFMAASCERQIASALAQQGALAVQSVRGAATELQESVGQYEQATGHSLDPKRFSNVDDVVEQCNRMQGDMLAGKQVDAGALDSTLLEAQEITLHAKIDGLRAQLQQLRAQAAQVGEGVISKAVAAFHSSFRSVGDAADSLEGDLAAVEQVWHANVEFAGMTADKASYGDARKDARRTQLAAAQQRFALISGNGNSKISAFLRDATTALKDQAKYVQIASTCIQILAMLGISFVASAAGGAVSRLVGSLLARGGGAELAELSLGARLLAAGGRVAAFGSGIATEAAVNVAGQHALGQDDPDAGFGTEMLENMIMAGGAQLILSRIGHELEFAEKLEKEAGVTWKTNAKAMIAANTATITTHAVLNIALSYVARQVTIAAGARKESAKSVVANTAQLNEWFMQGVSIALGRFAHSRFAPRLETYKKLAQLPNLPRARLLPAKAESLLRLGSTAETQPSSDAALQLMGRPRELLLDEKAVYDDLAKNPEARQAAGMSVSELAALQHQNAADRADVHVPGSESVPLIAAGLEDLGGGKLWTGTPKQIRTVLDNARTAHLTAHEVVANGVHTITVEGETFEVHERADTGTVKAAAPEHEARADGREQTNTTDKAEAQHPSDKRTSESKESDPSARDEISAAKRHGVPRDVPVDGVELRRAVAALYPDTVAKYAGQPHTASEKYNALISELEQLKPGELGATSDEATTQANEARARALLDQWTAISKEIAKSTGRDESDLRSLYNKVEKAQFSIWERALSRLPKEQQARMLHMYREELKSYVRELMTDDNSRRVLELRDRAVYGNPKGPTFEKLFNDNLPAAHGDPDKAYDAIIRSSKQSNKAVNTTIVGNESGVVVEKAQAQPTPHEVRAWADSLANSNPNKMTPEQRAAELEAFKGRRAQVKAMYDRVMRGEMEPPQGVTRERLRLAIEGDPETGERVPLTYGSVEQFHEFKAEVKAIFESEGITDATVVQLGSGTTGWSSAPGKTGKPWSTKSDVDFAIFSEQALAQAMQVDAPVNPKNQQDGLYTTLKNKPIDETGIDKKGFYDTSLGKKLKALSRRWNEKIFGDQDAEGFDFKLNLGTKAFDSAVPILFGGKSKQ